MPDILKTLCVHSQEALIMNILLKNTENINSNLKIIKKNEGIFCPVMMKKTNCEEFMDTNERFCSKNVSEKLGCSRVFRENDQAINSVYDLIPPGSFLESFIDYSNNITDGPDIFAYAAGLIVLSTLAQKNVYIQWAGNRLFANLYILLIAKSGDKKSTVLSLAKKLIGKFNTTDKFLVFPDDITPEALYLLCQNQSHGSFFHGEFGEWLRNLDKNYNKGQKEFFTDVFDNHSHRKFIKGKEGKGEMFYISEPAFNILTASTIAWVATNIKDADKSSGFMQRFVIFNGARDKHEIALPIANVDKSQILNNLTSKLEEIMQVSGEITLSTDASKYYESFFHSDAEFKKRQSEQFGSYQTRFYTIIIKLAMLYCIMRKDTIISKEDIAYGIKAKLLIEAQLFGVFDRLTTNEVKDNMDKIKNIILENGGVVDRSKLLHYSRLLAKDFNNYIGTMVESGQVTQKMENNKTKTTTYYSLVKE